MNSHTKHLKTLGGDGWRKENMAGVISFSNEAILHRFEECLPPSIFAHWVKFWLPGRVHWPTSAYPALYQPPLLHHSPSPVQFWIRAGLSPPLHAALHGLTLTEATLLSHINLQSEVSCAKDTNLRVLLESDKNQPGSICSVFVRCESNM